MGLKRKAFYSRVSFTKGNSYENEQILSKLWNADEQRSSKRRNGKRWLEKHSILLVLLSKRSIYKSGDRYSAKNASVLYRENERTRNAAMDRVDIHSWNSHIRAMEKMRSGILECCLLFIRTEKILE